MKLSLSVIKAGVLVLAVAALGLAGLASDKITDNAKAYQAELDKMMGQAPMTIVAKVTAWEFLRSDTWMAENPTPKDIGKHPLNKAKFSKQELQDIFSPPGRYKVGVYSKIVGTSQASMGTISDIGMQNNKDATFNVKTFTVIRMVFRDDKLVSIKVFPKIEGSSMSGGNSWRLY